MQLHGPAKSLQLAKMSFENKAPDWPILSDRWSAYDCVASGKLKDVELRSLWRICLFLCICSCTCPTANTPLQSLAVLGQKARSRPSFFLIQGIQAFGASKRSGPDPAAT